jgi:hypothetical protein
LLCCCGFGEWQFHETQKLATRLHDADGGRNLMQTLKLAVIMAVALATATVSAVVMVPTTAHSQAAETVAQAAIPATVPEPRPPVDFLDRLIQGSPWAVTDGNLFSLELVFERGQTAGSRSLARISGEPAS